MPEILTESFCERCGTRYTFEAAAPRAAKLKGIRVLSRGLKNFVLSDDSSMDEAMAAARSESEREQTSQQLDAFHKTFNFCMTCRQYTCGNCWNEAEGRCLTCAPHLGHEILPAPFPDLNGGAALGLANGTNGVHPTSGHGPSDQTDTLAWPTMDLEREDTLDIEPIDASARLAAIGAYGEEPPVEVAGDAMDPAVDSAAEVDLPVEIDTAEANAQTPEITTTAPEPVVTVEPAAPPPHDLNQARTEPVDVSGRAAAAAEQTSDLLRRFRPGQNLDAEIEAYEREQQAAKLTPVAPITTDVEVPAQVAAELEAPTPVDEDPEPALTERAAAAESPAAVPTEGPVAAPESGPAVHEDVVPQPTWRTVAPAEPAGTPPESPRGEPASPDAISASAEPQWPTQPEWPSQRPASGLAFLGRPAIPTGGLESLWAESAREVAAPAAPLVLGAAPARGAAGGVQPCVSCGLSLSATARFCRRCGNPQG